MKGILLAGGSGSRLLPLTRHTSKQLLPVYDKPLIYYPLSTLMLTGLRDIAIVSSPRDLESLRLLLGDGSAWGLNLTFVVQDEPRGIADAFRLTRPFLGDCSTCLILGDNILHGPQLGSSLAQHKVTDGAVIFAYEVADPSSYGVVEIDRTGKPLSLEEKPTTPRSHLAVPGLYFYAADAFAMANSLAPSHRGELEISDLNRMYLQAGRLTVVELPRGTAWLDCGTIEDLFEASTYVQVLTRRQGMRIACPEEIAWRNGWISDDSLEVQANSMATTPYGAYLLNLLK